MTSLRLSDKEIERIARALPDGVRGLMFFERDLTRAEVEQLEVMLAGLYGAPLPVEVRATWNLGPATMVTW